jgi:two-component system NtrC family response regulator
VPTILIVEDYETIREMLSETLGDRYECRAVRTAEEGLDVLGQEAVDVVVTDLKLPGMGGASLLGEVRDRYPGVPVIIITGGLAGTSERDFMELGAFGYLLKPYRAEEVEALIENALEFRRAAPRDAGGVAS